MFHKPISLFEYARSGYWIIIVGQLSEARQTGFIPASSAVKQGSLVWDATNPAKVKLEVTVDAKPITDPIVYRIKVESEAMLDAAKFPEIKFVSTAVRAMGGNRYEIDGQLTLLGMTKPAQIQASFVGTGRNIEGATTLGFTGSMNVNWPEYKGAGIASSVDVVTVGLDAEFMGAKAGR